MVVDRDVAAVAAHEGAQPELRRDGDLVRGDEAEPLFVPGLGGWEVRDVQHDMAEPEHMSRPSRHALGLAQAILAERGVPRRSLR